MPKKIPMRKCIVTQERYPKQELLRVVRTPEKEVVIDTTGRVNGHGAYVKKDPSLIETMKKKKCLENALEVEMPESFWEDLEKAMQ